MNNLFNKSNGGFDPTNILPELKEDTTTIYASENTVREIGTKDGSERVPSSDSYSLSPFEQGIISHFESRVSRVKEAAFEAKAKIDRSLKPIIVSLGSINGRYKDIFNRIEKRKEELSRDSIISLSPRFHRFILWFLAFGEFPLNAIVFRMFGETELMTYLMSSVLAISIPLMAFFTGILSRHWFSRLVGNAIIVSLVPLSIGGTLVATTYVRSIYVQNQGAISNATAHSGVALTWSIFALNLLVFSAATVTSFFAHDPDEQLDHLLVSIRNIEKVRKPLLNKYSEKAAESNAILRLATARINMEREKAKSMISAYRQANIAARRPNPTPMIFNKSIDFPTLSLWESLVEEPDMVSVENTRKV